MEELKRIKRTVFEIPLKNNKGEIIEYTKVDEDDYLRFNNQTQSLSKQGYVRHKCTMFHRLIMNAKPGEIIEGCVLTYRPRKKTKSIYYQY
jgi:hypothetical protein